MNASCADSNGVIILTATGGPSERNGILGAYMFPIDGGSTFIQGSNPMRFENLPAGFYDIVVVDTNFMECSGQTNVDLGTNSDIETTISTINESCFGRSDGSASVFATSAAGGFTYIWTQSPPVLRLIQAKLLQIYQVMYLMLIMMAI